MLFMCEDSQSRMTDVELADHWFEKQHQWSSSEIDFPRKNVVTDSAFSRFWELSKHKRPFESERNVSRRQILILWCCLFGLFWPARPLAWKKKNTELVDIFMVSCGVKAVTSLILFFPINFLKNKGLFFKNTIMIEQFPNKDGHNVLTRYSQTKKMQRRNWVHYKTD